METSTNSSLPRLPSNPPFFFNFEVVDHERQEVPAAQTPAQGGKIDSEKTLAALAVQFVANSYKIEKTLAQRQSALENADPPSINQ